MTPAVVIRVLYVNNLGEPLDPCYLQSFDVDAHEGRGQADYTYDVRDALVFPDAAAAMLAWRTVSTVRPWRADGEPNRPLTALTIEIEGAP